MSDKNNDETREARAELWGLTEIGVHYEVSKQRAGQWAELEDFPAPLARLAMGPVWDAREVRDWKEAREAAPPKVRRPPPHIPIPPDWHESRQIDPKDVRK